ncbi:hypothetical protein ACFE04_023768 [Oxalis oulophora]
MFPSGEVSESSGASSCNIGSESNPQIGSDWSKCNNHAPEDVPLALNSTLGDLQLDYLDLYLKMPKRRKFINPFKGLSGGSSAVLNNGEDNVSIQGKEPNVDSFSNTQSGNAIERQTVRKPNVEKDNESIQGKEPNVDSFSNTQSGNATKRQTLRKPNVEKDQGKTTKLNVSKVAQSYSHNVSESSATPSHNVTTKKNIKRKTFASNVSSGNVKRKKSVPKSANRSGSVSESSAAQSGTVGRSAAQSGTVGRSDARTNTTQTQSDTVGRSSAHTKQTRSGTAGRSSAHTASSSSYTRSGNGTKRKSSMPKVKTTRADSPIEKQTIRRRTKHSWTVDIINGEGIISHNVEAKVSDMFNLKEGVRVIVEWDKARPYFGCVVGLRIKGEVLWKVVSLLDQGLTISSDPESREEKHISLDDLGPSISFPWRGTLYFEESLVLLDNVNATSFTN